MLEGQCCKSPRDQREGHTDKESCHQVLQLHVKCTVHGDDSEGAGGCGVVWGEGWTEDWLRGGEGAHLCASTRTCAGGESAIPPKPDTSLQDSRETHLLEKAPVMGYGSHCTEPRSKLMRAV